MVTGARQTEPEDATFTLSELLKRSGVAAPTVHQYRRMGLLPDPARPVSNRFLYDSRHVKALLLIRELRDRRNLSLDTIGQLLPGLLDECGGAIGTDQWDEVVAARLREVDPSRPPARLLAAARDAFAQHGYDEVSVGDICLAAGMAKGSFYRYFASKEEVFLAAARSVVDVVGEVLDTRDGRVPEDKAIEELGDLLAGLVPLFLEVVLRALHGQPGHADVVSDIISGIGDHAARRAGISPNDAGDEGSRLTEAALAQFLRARFEPTLP
jgi:AcrR family transcriptional regulator